VFADGGGGVEIVGDLCREDVVTDADGLAERLRFYFEHPDDPRAADARRDYARRFDIRVTAAAFRQLYVGLRRCAG
jgi:glycosyltransferase involved in cell wall biosynthesis